jgi:hypothetical protein
MESLEGDPVLQDIARKIDREKVLIQGAIALRNSTENFVVQQKCDTNIRESKKNIEYLEDRMRQLQVRKRNSIDVSVLSQYPSSPQNQPQDQGMLLLVVNSFSFYSPRCISLF